MKLWWFAYLAVALSGCVDAKAVDCGDYVCPSGNMCVAGGCALPADVAACNGLADGALCDTAISGAGTCQDGVCRSGLCGNAVTDLGEVCDDGNHVSGDGCRADCGKLAAGVPKHFALFRGTYDAELPAAYRMLLDRFNGLAIYPLEEGEAFAIVSAHELGEPILWPLDSYGDHEQLVDADFDEIALPYVFGEIADSGMFAFDVTPEAPVFWVPRRFASEAPMRLTDSLGEFVSALAEARGHGPALLRAKRVPGWDG